MPRAAQTVARIVGWEAQHPVILERDIQVNGKQEEILTSSKRQEENAAAAGDGH